MNADDMPPIAIVGRACLLPGADSPGTLYELVREGRVCLSDTPAGRWRLPETDVLTSSTGDALDKTWTKRGGYVEGFRFVPAGFRVPAERLVKIDPLFQWTLHTARRALADAERLDDDTGRTGAVLGNLSLPSSGQSRFAERVWLGRERADAAGIPSSRALDRFNSGMPAHLLGQALGLGLPSYALDAACASSLYAIELACRALASGRADRMLAGAINRADDLFIHVGFCALGAMSRTGQSRPFHRDADGLVPGEGCGFVVLERLDDAVRRGSTIHGVIRGIGLSNDGRGAGLLAPSERGQARCMRAALAQAGLTASDIPYVECHATGTTVGDATELASMEAVYGGASEAIRIGSLKANLGHLITAAGVAGLIKILESLRHGVMLPTPSIDAPSDALSGSSFRALARPEKWRGPRRAGLSAFGFGGNNAHLIVEAYEGEAAHAGASVSVPVALRNDVVVVSVGARVGDGGSLAAFENDPDSAVRRAKTVQLPLASLRFPPNDLKKTNGQQTMLLAAALEATDGISLDSETTGVFIGYQCDPEISRWGARWRARSWGMAGMEDKFVVPLEAAHVVGTLPNIPANRLSSQLDLQGPSYTTSAEELSGVRALEIAVRTIARGSLEAALVGAVDLSDEPVHLAASGAATGQDAAVALVLMRRELAESQGLPVFASIEVDVASDDRPLDVTNGAHAASGLVAIVRAVVAAARAEAPGEQTVTIEARGAQRASVTIRGDRAALAAVPASSEPSLELEVHPAPVELSTPSPISTNSNTMQKMDPAPWLPPVSGGAPLSAPNRAVSESSERPPARSAAPASFASSPTLAALPVPSAPKKVIVPRQSAPREAAPPRPNVAPSVGAAWLATFTEHQRQVAAAHQAFVAQQTKLHERFLKSLSPPAIQSAAASVPSAIAPSAPRTPAHTLPRAVPVSSPVARPAIAPSPKKALAQTVVHAPVEAPAPRPLALSPRGPSFTREQLAIHSGGAISEIFGPEFTQQDRYAVQVRMPEPPLLLADRCTGLEAEAGSMKKGICWTETDVREDSWWLHHGHMPAGIMIESGQADLFLISYLGADFLNRGERAYRLLGCEMTWFGDLPAIGETLAYDIHIDGHAAQGDVRLFFFHYDCHVERADGTSRPALQVRGGQAGFFTAEELAESAGILWRAEEQEIKADARVDRPSVPLSGAHTYDRTKIEAFAAGRPWDCFGEGFLRTKTHSRTPRIQDGRMLFLDHIETLDPTGGPWGRGYLKAVTPISPDDWFFEGHFKNDPCMPGTLMLEGCLQAMAFYLAALGYTVERDGWRFAPIENEPYSLRCRGQVIPSSKSLVYEIFVEEVHDGPVPMLYADLLCTVDGLGAFHARRFGLKLTPSWPLAGMPELTKNAGEDLRCATASFEGGPEFRFDYPSLLACAWGKPSAAFGPMYARFDTTRRTPRLPAPPYHFLSRITKIDGPIGGLKKGTTIEFDYDVPPDAWYFDENGHRVMPFAVLLEAALQPCGWTASFVGSTLAVDSDLLFRNLDGTGTIKAEVFETSGTLRTTVEIKSISQSAGMIIESFNVHCYLGDTEVYELDTVFGFFPPEAFEDQPGLPIGPEDRALFDAPSNTQIDLTTSPYRGSLRLAEPMLLMIDRVTYFDPAEKTMRAEKDVDPGEWFFKSHFYQDPVQPGSLGIEAMLQLLQVYMLESGMAEGMTSPRFEAIAVDREHVWKYRGQVVPKNEVISTTLAVTETGTDERGVFAIARASLWVDGKRIYESHNLGMRIVAGEPDAARDSNDGLETLHPDTAPWLLDHCPTFALPALPMMSMVDRMMAAARRELGECDGLTELQVGRWVVIEGETPTRIKTEIVPLEATNESAPTHEARLSVWRDARNPALSRYEVAARAKIGAPRSLAPITTLDASTPRAPYGEDRLFHGPAFQMMKSFSVGARGASATIDAGAGSVPYGTMNQGLLDAATHAIVHDELHLWSDRIGRDVVGFPHRLDVRFDGPAPRHGIVHCDARFIGFEEDDARLPVFRLQLRVGERVFADMRLVETLLPKGRLGAVPAPDRRRFLRDGEAVAGVGLSSHDESRSVLEISDVLLCDWFPGTVRSVYGVKGESLAVEVAVKDHFAHRLGVHPRDIEVEGGEAHTSVRPLTSYPVSLTESADQIVVTSEPARLDVSAIAEFWREHFGVGPWPVEDLYYGLVERFVGAFHVEDPAAFRALSGRSVLYLGNHQVGIESLIFSIVGSALLKVPTLTLAKTEHRQSWLGELIAHCFTWPGVTDPGVITYFDRSDPTSLPRIATELADSAAARSLLVHVEGTRAHVAGQPVSKMSGIFCDLAIQANVPVVPIRFTGGLPLTPVDEKLEYPVGMGRQDYWLGRPIAPAELAALPYKERIARVVDSINRLGPKTDPPSSPDPAFEAKAAAWSANHDVGLGLSAVACVLKERAELSEEGHRLVRTIDDPQERSQDRKGDPRQTWHRGLAKMFGA